MTHFRQWIAPDEFPFLAYCGLNSTFWTGDVRRKRCCSREKTARCTAALLRRCTRLWRAIANPVRRGLCSAATSRSSRVKSSLGLGAGGTYRLDRCRRRFFCLSSLGALSDPKSRLGSRFREKSVEATQFILWNAAFPLLMWVGFSLVFWAGVYDPFLGLAVFLCWALLLLLLVRRAFKSDIEALDDPNDHPHASRLIGKSREPGSYDDRN
jgi:hypothetical protein